MKDTKIFIDTFKGHQIFAIWKVDEQGNKKGKYPLFSAGRNKLVALFEYADQALEFATSPKPEKESK